MLERQPALANSRCSKCLRFLLHIGYPDGRGHYAFVELLEQLYKERDLVPYSGGSGSSPEAKSHRGCMPGGGATVYDSARWQRNLAGAGRAFDADWSVPDDG